MLSPLERIKQKVLHKERDFDLFYWADIFMNEYGMNFEEFKELKIPTFYYLKDAMEKRYKEQEKQMKNKRGRR